MSTWKNWSGKFVRRLGKQPVGGKPIEGGSNNPSSDVSNPMATFVLLVDFKSIGSIVCGWLQDLIYACSITD